MKPLAAIVIALVIATLIFPAILGEYNPKAATYIPSSSMGSLVSLGDTAFIAQPGDKVTVSGTAFAKTAGHYSVFMYPLGAISHTVVNGDPTHWNYRETFTVPDFADSTIYGDHDTTLFKCSSISSKGTCMGAERIDGSVTLSWRLIKPAGAVVDTDKPVITIISPNKTTSTTTDDTLVMVGKVSHPNLRDAYIYFNSPDGIRTKVDLTLAETDKADSYSWATNIPLSENSTNFIYIHAVTATGEISTAFVSVKYDPDQEDKGDPELYAMWGITLLVAFFILSKINVGGKK